LEEEGKKVEIMLQIPAEVPVAGEMEYMGEVKEGTQDLRGLQVGVAQVGELLLY
jgi:hypothetical protein